MGAPGALFALAAAALLGACGARSTLPSAGGTGSGGGGGPGVLLGRTLSVSWTHSCAVDGSGHVLCWGQQDSAMAVPTPTLVEGLEEVVEIATGQSLDCARHADGSVSCWGPGTGGMIVSLPGVTFASVVAGAAAVCGVTQGGVACAGSPFLTVGECNTGGTTWSPTAVTVPGLSGVAGIALGEWSGCAFDGGGATSCWGCAGMPYPESPWVLGSMAANTATPVAVPGVSATVRLAGETETTCAVQADGSTWCWGDESQFGPGIVAHPVGPTLAAFPASPLDLDVGVTFSCAAYADEVQCLGGIPTFADGCQDRLSDPVSFPVEGVQQVSVGYEHACARDAGGGVWCWGCNGSGEVGDGTMTARATPVHVL